MNTSKTTLWLLATTVSVMGTVANGAEKKPAAEAAQVRSVFTQPTNSKEGRDPFFPESTRLSEILAAATKKVEVTTLKVPGISGTPGNLLAIINNHTFSVGDEGDVLTPSGRVHVRCLEIRPDSVLVEINGQNHRIKLEAP